MQAVPICFGWKAELEAKAVLPAWYWQVFGMLLLGGSDEFEASCE